MSSLDICLAEIKTRTELANALAVDVKALGLVKLLCTTCTTAGCNYPAVENNHKRCILCQQSWFPRQYNKKGKLLKNCRGHGLYGPQFMRTWEDISPTSCCCEMPLCEKIGYSHHGMFALPTDPDQRKEAIRVLGIKTPEIVNNLMEKGGWACPWHYRDKHRVKGDDGAWQLRKMPKYWDADGKRFDYPPPNADIQLFIDNEIPAHGYSRGGYDDSLPPWVAIMIKCEEAAEDNTPSTKAATPKRGNKVRKTAAATPSPRPPRKRQSPEAAALEEAEDEKRMLRAQLQSALDGMEGLTATVEARDNEIIQIRIELKEERLKNTALERKIKELEERNGLLSYDALRPGGILEHFVKDFSFFPDFESTDKFLDMINYTDKRGPGNGLCENMVRYSKVTRETRKEYNDALRAEKENRSNSDTDDTDQMNIDDNDDDMSIGSNAGTGLDDIEGAAVDEAEEEEIGMKVRGRQRKLDWKTEFLVYCFYARCNMSMRRTAALFGIKATLVHDIVYAWANILCITLRQFFPVPTRSQMLRAYPKSIIQKFGHAKIFMMLDATECFADIASMKSVNAILFSAYKHKSTLKWLVGCDGIGTTWDESISDAYPGSISDPMQTAVTKILDQIPFGFAVEVDKGFLIENECALQGIITIRPMKMLQNQTQQSKEDSNHTQKVGKSRIVIEQANGQMKNATAWFDKNVKVNQIGLADLIFRSSYLLQNFKLGFIQGRNNQSNKERRPCKAEIRYYGGEDDGLIDVRPYVELWGNESEMKRWEELRSLSANEDLSDTEISELLLKEDLPSQLRTRHIDIIESLDN